MELFISFLVGFLFTWFLIREDGSSVKTKICPQKETIVQLVDYHHNDKKIKREIREYSLLKIQEGHYEYGEVLTKLSKKESYDKV